MTLQELINLGYQKYIVEQQPPSYDTARGICMYDGPKGEHCLIGWALAEAGIPVVPVKQRAPVLALCDSFPDVRALFEDIAIGKLADAQLIHDDAAARARRSKTSFADHFTVLMTAFCRRHGLTWPGDVAQD